MTSWIEALPAFVLALLILLVPGLLVMAALRIKSLAALTLAPAVSISIVATSAVVAPLIHLPWNWPVVLLGTAITVAGAYLGRRYIPALNHSESVPEKRGMVPAALLGVAGALVTVCIIVMLNASNPEQFTQGYDTVFHLNATEYAVRTGDASSFDISHFITVNEAKMFYPAAWHGLASLLVVITGISVPAATNVLWLAVAGVVWPLGCVFLTRVLIAENRTAVLAAGVLAGAFPAFPYLLLKYGSAYPNALSNAIVPVGIGLVLLIIRPAAHKLIDPPMALAVVVLYMPGTVTAQPNGIFSILVVLSPLLLWLLYVWIRTGWMLRKTNGVLRLILVVGLAAGATSALFLLPQIRSLFNYTNPAFLPFWAALLRSFTQAPDPVVFPAVALVILILIAARKVWREHRLYWLVVAFVLLCFSYPMTAGTNNVLSNALLAPWWDNPERIAALMPLVGVPLAAIGLAHVLTLLARRFPYRMWWAGLGASRAAGAMLLALAITFSNPGLWQVSGSIGNAYNVPEEPNGFAQIDAHELSLIHRLDQLTGPNDVIANNPYNGSALAMALADKNMLFPYSSQGQLSADQYLLRFWLNRVGSDQNVCAAAKRLGVTYLLDFGTDYIPAFDDPRSLYPGVTLAGDSQGFTLVAKDGHAALYKLTLCGGVAVN